MQYMNIQSHLLVAMAMEKHIKEKYDLILRPDMFYYGNIRPDLTPRGEKKAPHTFQDSLCVFMRHCSYLMDRSRLVRPPLYVFSYRLGIILHYTADFFTYAHHDPALFRQGKEHFRYENALLNTILSTPRRDPGLPDPYGKRLDSFLLESLVLYDQEAENPMWDADFIYFVSQVVCDRLVERIYMEKDARESRWQNCFEKTRGIYSRFIQ